MLPRISGAIKSHVRQIKIKKNKKNWINLQKITGCTFGNLCLKPAVEGETGVAVQLEEKKNPKDTNYRKQYDKPTRDTHTCDATVTAVDL